MLCVLILVVISSTEPQAEQHECALGYAIMNNEYVDNVKVKQFVELLTAHQSRIHLYILSLVTNYNDADDVMQETSKMMWSKFHEFEMGTDFLAWGIRIAFYRVFEYRRQRKKDRALHLKDETIHEIEHESRMRQDRSGEYKSHLRHCMAKLASKDIDLVGLRYGNNVKVKEIAHRLGQSVQNVYQNLSRIHDLLLSCVQRSLSLEDRS